MGNNNETPFEEAIDSVINLIASNVTNEIFDKIDTSIDDENIEFSENHISEVNKILFYKKSFVKTRKINTRMLLIAIIAIILTLGFTISTGADRLKFLNFFMNIYNEGTEFRLDDNMYDTEYSQEEDITENLYEVVLDYIPDGYTITNKTISKQLYSVQYTNKDKYFNVDKSIIPSTFDIDTENVEIKTIYINGNQAFFSSKPNLKILFWIDNNILYELDGNIDEETLINIANNIK